MADHVDPVHAERFGFCRQACEECDRLDREEYATGESQETALARGVIMALAAQAAAEREGTDERR